MTIGTGDAIVKYGTQKTLEAGGASAANNTMVQADDANYVIASDGANAPDAEFALAVAFSVAPTQNTTIDLYVSEQNIDGTNDAQAPTTTYRQKYVGSFTVNSVTSTQYLRLLAYDVPPDGAYYLHNNGTGQTMSSGWTLKVTPRTIGPSA